MSTSDLDGGPPSKKFKPGTEDDGFAGWRSTIPDEIGDITNRAIGEDINAHLHMRTAIRNAWTNASNGHSSDRISAVTTPLKKAVFMCTTGAVVSAEFPPNDTTLNETFSVLKLPESLAYPHPVRACNVCYDADKVAATVTSYVDGGDDASSTAHGVDSPDAGLEKAQDLLVRVATFNSWDARIHLECTMHVSNVNARNAAAAAAAATGGTVSVPQEVHVLMAQSLEVYNKHAEAILRTIAGLSDILTRNITAIGSRLNAIEKVVIPHTDAKK
jgi:hypothetical protein